MEDFLIHLWIWVRTEDKCWRDKHNYQKQRRGQKRSGKEKKCPFMIFIKKSLLFGAFSRWKTRQAPCWKSGLCFSFTHSAWSKHIDSFVPLLEKMPLLFKLKNNLSSCGCCEGILGPFPWVLTLEETGQVEIQEYENTDAETWPTVLCFWTIGYSDVIFVALRKP